MEGGRCAGARTDSTPNTFTAVEFAPVEDGWRCASKSRWTPTRRSGSPSGASDRSRRWRPLTDLRFVRRSRSTAKSSTGRSRWPITAHGRSRSAISRCRFPFAERTGARGDIYTRKLLRHALVAGHGSWIYWQRSDGEGPYLVMTPDETDEVRVLRQLRPARSRRTFTRRPRAPWLSPPAATGGCRSRSLELAPKGAPGSEVTYAFRFQWAKDFAGVRERALRRGQVRHRRRARHGRARPICRR